VVGKLTETTARLPVADMQQMADWLRKLGMPEYIDRFVENKIDSAVLPDLTDQHLKDLGIALGDRLKMLRAIREFRGTAPGSLTTAEPTRQDSAERRQLTVMFCDLVDSTALSARLDPEDLREIIRGYHRCCADLVERNGGFVAKYMGDGILAYFGYPQSHEHDAERAVRAALALVDAVPKLESAAGSSLRVRVGIATGLVVVGELIGAGAAQEQAVVGETPNLAARLQMLAEPGAVVIASSTRRLTVGLFEYRDLGSVALKGFAEEVQAWQVLGAGVAESRFEAQHETGVTPLVGREEEMDLLLQHWEQARGGNGRVVLISGEPGIGKSRIIRALEERLTDEPHTRLSYFCSPHHQDSALHPTIVQLERAAGFARDDTANQKLAKLERLLARSTIRTEEIGLIAALLSLPTEGRYRLPEFSPQLRKEKTLDALMAQVEGLAARQPVLFVSEDVHWIDPTSLEALTLTAQCVPRLPVLLVITCRPEFVPRWPDHARVFSLPLTRLSHSEVATLVAQVTGGKTLPEEVMNQILARTDGVPLFVEELTKMVVESGLLREQKGRYALIGPLPPLAIPTTLHASLMARLDRLSTVREIAQIGGAIGREFTRELLRALVPISEAALDAALNQLVASGLVFRRGTPPVATYVFKHALVQDAAYDTLLRSRRQELHARIATALEQHFPEIADLQPEFLAKHCTQAGLIERAIDYWGRAGRQSIARSALVEATVQLRKGLDLLVGLPESPERSRRELELQSALGGAMYASKGPAASETGHAYARARELCEQLGDTSALVPVLCGQSTYRLGRCELAAARQIAEDLLRLVQTRDEAADHLIANRTMGACLFWLGDFGLSAKHMERVLNIYVPEAHECTAAVAVYDMQTVALIYLSLDLFALGHPEQALSRSKQALMSSKNQSHRQGYAFALSITALLHLLHRAESKALRVLDELISLAAEQRFQFWLTVADILRGHALCACGETRAGLALARKGLADQIAGGSHLNETCYLGLLAQSCERAGEVDEALVLLATALETAEATGERWFEAELHRLKGTWLMTHRRGDQKEAEAHLLRAMSVARGQNAKMLELRAATNLCRFWRDQGKRAEGNRLLTGVYGWFIEGFDTTDLQDARALLEEVK
jgi:predicted ATPase/class 3 adenylate cyclase